MVRPPQGGRTQRDSNLITNVNIKQNILINILGLAALIGSDAIGFEVQCDEQVPQLAFAADKVREALNATGQKDAAVIFEVKPDAKNPESFSIERPDSGKIVITGSDSAGAMYGGLEVAEELRIGGLQAVQADEQKPYMEMRGIKFNIPLDVRTPSYSDMGDAGQNNIETVWDFSFWKAFIDEVAGQRYNYISLWNLHPFPSMVKVPDYPDVALDDVRQSTNLNRRSFSGTAAGYDDPEVLNHTIVLKKMTMDEKIDFWRKVMAYGKSRHVDFYVVTWNIYAYGAKGKYGITHAADNPITIDYFRKSVKQLFLTYPDLKGIGLTTGEDMHGGSSQDKENWAYKTYGLGVLDVVKEQPERKITFLHRQHQSGALEIADTFKPLIDHPNVDFIFSFKYAQAHVYSAPVQHFGDKFLKEIKGRGGLKTVWTMRNDSTYLYRLAAPDFVRTFVQNIPHDLSRGYYLGSDGWIWGREFISNTPQIPRQLELDKHWFEWMLWGRLAYNPNIDNARFAGILQSRFPGVKAPVLMEAWQAASMVFPLTTGFHWGALDFQWYPEGCKSQPSPAQTKTGFHDVNRFITLKPHPDSGYVSIPDYVKIMVAGKPFKGTGPLEVAQQLHTNADHALSLIKTLKSGGDRELAETVGDIETLAYLGHYYGHKIAGATQLHLYRETGEKAYQAEAVSELEKAAQVWRQYTASSLKQYKNPLWLNRVGMIDWVEITQGVDEDIEIAKKDSRTSESSSAEKDTTKSKSNKKKER